MNTTPNADYIRELSIYVNIPNIKEEVAYNFKCYDGHAIGTLAVGRPNAPKEIKMFYPTIGELTIEQMDYILEYRGLFDLTHEDINYGDVMMALGELKIDESKDECGTIVAVEKEKTNKTKDYMNNEFYTAVFSKIAKAFSKKDEGNTIDMRLYINDSHLIQNIYSISEVEELYKDLQKYECRTWFIDFYENIAGANSAEFMDIALYSEDVYNIIESKVLEDIEKNWGKMGSAIITYIKVKILPNSINIFTSLDVNFGETYCAITDDVTAFMSKHLDEVGFGHMWEWINNLPQSDFNNILGYMVDGLTLDNYFVNEYLVAFCNDHKEIEQYDVNILMGKKIEPMSEEISCINIEKPKYKYVYNLINTDLYEGGGVMGSTIVTCNCPQGLENWGFHNDDIDEISKLEIGDSWTDHFMYGKGVVVVRMK